ncbi:MAG: type I restriction endonuclease subunit R [Thermoanaerobaculia bacterium]
MAFTESIVEEAVLDWFRDLGYTVVRGAEMPPSGDGLRETYAEVVLPEMLRASMARLNPSLPPEAIHDAFRKLTRSESVNLVARNRAIHQMLINGVDVEFPRADGSIAGGQARVIDFENPANNDWMVINQFTVTEDRHTRRPDVVVFVNGLPVALLELKNPADEDATIAAAMQQVETYKAQIPSLFAFNEAIVVSDGVKARVGTLTGGFEWYKPWRTIDGDVLAPAFYPEIQVMIEGLFDRRRLLEMIAYFEVFEDSGDESIVKKMAGYHQFHAVNVALEETLRAARSALIKRIADDSGRYESGRRPGGEPGDRRVGVVWHTQGSGKSLTMAFYAGRVILHPAMANPTVVVITDRNDLDEQLFGTFARCKDLLRQEPVQVTDRADLRTKLAVASGGVVFTTIQKFFPEEKGDKYPVLSERRNIVVIADEAHRSQYDFIDGFARHMRDALPNASFIGFTGTPIELTDKNTRAVFGDYISVYDIQRAVEDGATVPIYYESRLAKLSLSDSERPRIDPDFEEATEGEEIDRKEKLKSKWAQLEAVVGSERRLKLIAEDLVRHFETRQEAINGKAMIVCMSRRICVELYREIAALRPEWHNENDESGSMKVVMTGSASDPLEWQQHIGSKLRREELANRFRDPADPFRIVIVRDMWLTGFDVPSLHTMYVDKPMHGHGLMQAIARVNRVFRDKSGGLVVDYLGLADQLRKALATYTENGGTGEAALDQSKAVDAMQQQVEICRGIFYGLDWSKWITGKPHERLGVLPQAQEHVLALPDGKSRLDVAVRDLASAFALAVPHKDAIAIRDEVGFYQAVKAVLAKTAEATKKTDYELNHAIQQIVSKVIVSDEVIDIFAAAGLKKPDISILSDEFLAEVKGMPHKNLAVELLRKLLAGEIKTRSKHNVVQARSFAELLENAIKKYQNRAIETAQVIEELIELAKELKAADRRGADLGLNEDELAFYDALETNDSAVKVLGDDTLKMIARELVETVRKSVTIDWTVRENVRAGLRVIVKRILRKYGYPPDKQEKATQTVLEQAEVLSEGWVDSSASIPGDRSTIRE